MSLLLCKMVFTQNEGIIEHGNARRFGFTEIANLLKAEGAKDIVPEHEKNKPETIAAPFEMHAKWINEETYLQPFKSSYSLKKWNLYENAETPYRFRLSKAQHEKLQTVLASDNIQTQRMQETVNLSQDHPSPFWQQKSNDQPSVSVQSEVPLQIKSPFPTS